MFIRGEKTKEFRLHGPRWNTKTCRVGREVTLSRGYGTTSRRAGTIVGVEIITDQTAFSPAFVACYTDRLTPSSECIAIEIQLAK